MPNYRNLADNDILGYVVNEVTQIASLGTLGSSSSSNDDDDDDE